MHEETRSSPWRILLSTIPALLVLLLAVAQGSSEMIQARMLATGEQIWPGYAEIRKDPTPPDCDPDQIREHTAKPAPTDAESEALLDDLFDETPAKPEAAAPATPADGDDALLDDLFGDSPAKQPNAQAIEAAVAHCIQSHDTYNALVSRITPAVRVYRNVDSVLSAVTNKGREFAKLSLIFLIALCAATASAVGAHISIRPMRRKLDATVAGSIEAVGAALAAFSCLSHYQITMAEGVGTESASQTLVWGFGFIAVSVLAIRRTLKLRSELEPGGSFATALLSAPLFGIMALLASAWFLGVEHHPSGIAIYLDMLAEQAGIYLQVGMFVWAGTMLKQTLLTARVFDVLRPWRMSPEMLTAIVVLLSAIPTAYSGASGIYVIAAGGLLYDELRKAGARNKLSIAATAMSGSLGVVLSPCLLIVIIASLNRQVTTSDLFGAGYYVFALTSIIFVAILYLTRTAPVSFAPPKEAWGPTKLALFALRPYAILLIGILAIYAFALDAWIDEHNASTILLAILLAFVAWEGRAAIRAGERQGTFARLSTSTTETTLHIGALLTLMSFSTAFGGVIERSEIVLAIHDLGGPITAMALLVFMLIIIGMLMDPYGAVILVSATLAHVADQSGIHPLHFWMVVLVSFELGFLTPPVALNQLLARSVIGERAHDNDVPAGASFWYRHEDLLLPIAVLGVAQLLVAFVPFTFY